MGDISNFNTQITKPHGLNPVFSKTDSFTSAFGNTWKVCRLLDAIRAKKN